MLNKLLTILRIKRQREPSPTTTKCTKRYKCPICADLVVNSVLTSCGHVFCEYCLNQAMLYSNLCPICRKKINPNSAVPCKALDALIRSKLNDNQKSSYLIRYKKSEEWKDARKLKETKVGMKIDVLDKEGTWCQAIIKFKIDSGDKHQFLYISYIGWDHNFDEVIPENSYRFAPIGFYTSKDIPNHSNTNPE